MEYMMNNKMMALDEEKLIRSVLDFKEYLLHVEPMSAKDEWIHPSHFYEYGWADNLQYNQKTSTQAPRGHLKSSLLHAFVKWKALKCQDRNEEWMYMCYIVTMAKKHVSEIKEEIKRNPVFKDAKDLSDADSIIKLTWDGKHVFEIIPTGILTFTRGLHRNVICDDILADPDNQLKPVVLKKITRLFEDNVMFIPNPGQELHVVGTPQHEKDLFDVLSKTEGFVWKKFRAIMDRTKKLSLWPERYDFKTLLKMETNKPTSFRKEMMCEPVWNVSQFIPQKTLMTTVNPNLKNYKVGDETCKIDKEIVVSGMDIGKKTHPSHLSIWKYDRDKKKLVNIHDVWMDKWNYIDQVNYLNEACKFFKVDLGYYDSTRGEFDGFAEQNKLHSSQKPMSMTVKSQGAISSSIEKWFGEQKLELLSIQRTVDQILAVNGDLDAYESEDGHGDSFWSVGMAVYAYDQLEKNKVKVRSG